MLMCQSPREQRVNNTAWERSRLPELAAGPSRVGLDSTLKSSVVLCNLKIHSLIGRINGAGKVC